LVTAATFFGLPAYHQRDCRIGVSSQSRQLACVRDILLAWLTLPTAALIAFTISLLLAKIKGVTDG
jgi:phosphate/sulfate permease